MGIPNLITRQHILRGIKETAESGVPERRRSRDYCLVFEDKHYPPKYVISQAAKYAIGRELGPHEFYGGEGSTCANVFLRSRGFEVVKCKCDRDFPIKTREATETPSSVEELIDGDRCCGDLFKEFVFEDLVEAQTTQRERNVCDKNKEQK